jgi:hypothetical protein
MSNICPEQWLPIEGFDGYEVSNFGRVRSVDRLVKYANGRDCRRRGQVLKPAVVGSGYLQVSLGSNACRRIHILVAEAFIGPRPNGMVVCHNDGERMNNSVANLRYDTPSANIVDQVKHGTHALGSRTHCKWGHELTPENVYPREWRRKDGTIGIVRQCLACHYRRVAERRAKKKSALRVSDNANGTKAA